MRTGGGRALSSPPRLDGQYRFAVYEFAGDLASQFDKGAAVHKSFQVHQYHVGAVVVGKITQQIDFGYVGFIADADEFRESDVAASGIVENARAESAALRKESDVAVLGHTAREARVEHEVGIGVDHAEAVRADQRNLILAGDLHRTTLQRGTLGSNFLESCRHDHGPACAFLATFFQDLRHRRGRDHNQCEIDVVRNLADVRVCMYTGNRRRLGIDRVQRTAVTAEQDVAKQIVTNRPHAIRCADHRHRTWTKDGFESFAAARSPCRLFRRSNCVL